MEISESIKRQISNPFLWLAIIGAILTLSESYNQIESNERYIKTVEQRLAKKTVIQQSLIMEIELKTHGILLLRKDMDLLELELKKDLELLKVTVSMQ